MNGESKDNKTQEVLPPVTEDDFGFIKKLRLEGSEIGVLATSAIRVKINLF